MNKHLTIKRIIDDLMDVMELRGGILRTLYYLSFKPKYVISSYIEDRKGDFSGPIRIFYITFFDGLFGFLDLQDTVISTKEISIIMQADIMD